MQDTHPEEKEERARQVARLRQSIALARELGNNPEPLSPDIERHLATLTGTTSTGRPVCTAEGLEAAAWLVGHVVAYMHFRGQEKVRRERDGRAQANAKSGAWGGMAKSTSAKQLKWWAWQEVQSKGKTGSAEQVARELEKDMPKNLRFSVTNPQRVIADMLRAKRRAGDWE